MKDTNFHLLSEEYDKLLITKDKSQPMGDVRRIPYYQFIYDNSVGKELVERIIAKQRTDKDISSEKTEYPNN